jgi:hypothetical protein
MLEETITLNAPRIHSEPVRAAMTLIESLVLEGMRHGHFDYSITCETGTNGRRLLIVRQAIATSSRSRRLTFPANSRVPTVIPRTGTLKMQIILRSTAIGRMPKPTTRDAERREAGRVVVGESCKRQSER